MKGERRKKNCGGNQQIYIACSVMTMGKNKTPSVRSAAQKINQVKKRKKKQKLPPQNKKQQQPK